MEYIAIDNGVSKGGMLTITSTLTIVYWYTALKKLKYKNYKIYQS